MAFSDWWTAFLAVVSAAFAMFLADNEWAKNHHFLIPTLWTASGCLLLICLFVFLRKKFRISRIESKPASSQPNNGGEGKLRKAPHFKFMGLKRRNVFISPDPRRGVHEPLTEEERQVAISVFTASFTNLAQADGTSLDGFNVVAKLRFFTENWVTYKDIEYAVWIGSAAESNVLDVGHTEEIFLIGEFDGRKFSLRDRRKNSHYYSQWGEDIQYVEDVTVAGFPFVEVMLIDGRTHVSQKWILRVEIEGGASATVASAYPPVTAQRLPD